MPARFALFAVIALSASPLSAQDGSEVGPQRSVEGAQKFLADYYASLNRQIHTLGNVWQTDGVWRVLYSKPAAYTQHAFIDGQLAGLDPVERCKMVARVTQPRAYTSWALETGSPVAGVPDTLSATLDFTKLTKVTVEPNMKLLKDPLGEKVQRGWTVTLQSDPALAFVHQDEESAKRAAFALQFLVDQCGFKSDTGF